MIYFDTVAATLLMQRIQLYFYDKTEIFIDVKAYSVFNHRLAVLKYAAGFMRK